MLVQSRRLDCHRHCYFEGSRESLGANLIAPKSRAGKYLGPELPTRLIKRLIKRLIGSLRVYSCQSHSSILGKSHAPFLVGDADDVNYALARLDAGRHTPLWIQLL